MHPLHAAPPHLLKLLRQLIVADVSLDTIVEFIDKDWRPGFTPQDLLDWAGLEGITTASPACVPQPEGGIPASDTQPPFENPSISKHFKPNQSQQADCYPTTPVSLNGPAHLGEFETISEISVSKHFKPNQTHEPPPSLPSAETTFFSPSGIPSEFAKISGISVSPPAQRRRTGKVAQLPHAIREQVNIMLDDGQTYREVVAWLDARGHPGFNQENISNWAQGGFQDWLNLRDKLDQAKILAQYAREVVEQCPGTTFQEASQALIEMNFFDLLNRFDPEPLHKLLHEKPEYFFRLMSSMTAFNRDKLAKDKFERQKREGVGSTRAPTIAPREGATSTSAPTPPPPPDCPAIEQTPFHWATTAEIQPLNFYFHPDSLPTTIIPDTPMTIPYSFIYKPWEGASSTSAQIFFPNYREGVGFRVPIHRGSTRAQTFLHTDLSMPPDATPIDLSTPESNVSQCSNPAAWG